MGSSKMFFKKILPIIAILTVFFSFSIGFPGQAASQENIKIYIGGEEKLFDVSPQVFNGSTFLPMRGIFESLGAQVSWDDAQKRVTAVRKAVKISLKVGETSATVNGKTVKLDKAPLVYKGTTMVPVRFVSEALGETVEWDQNARSVYIGGRPYISSETKQVKVNGKTFSLNIVRVDLNNKKIGMKIVLAKDALGFTESLKDMAKRNHALAAINGTYFNAYEDLKEPTGNIMVDHRVVHLGNYGTTFGFTDDNQVRFDVVKFMINGITNKDGRDIEWEPYAINRTPPANLSTIVLYTPDRGSETRFNSGISVVVENGVITKHLNGNVVIPKNGFVVNLSGTETRYLDRFPIGGKASFSPAFEPSGTDVSFWQKAAGALGVGPRLITDGKITVDPISEGFSSEKILSYSMARSAIGVTANNMLLMVTVNRATIRELASIMHSLGAYNAMNLDGGASSGLYYGGRYLTAPGRDLSNALIIYKKND
ncbi:MAG: hypothetical protein PWR06_661 [Thermoanaerobacteraceae bacterium]|nr:hypothetical protein [Thermoanaerobacteraceae bacterium]